MNRLSYHYSYIKTAKQRENLPIDNIYLVLIASIIFFLLLGIVSSIEYQNALDKNQYSYNLTTNTKTVIRRGGDN